ncbi:MAG TPA: ABC transporter [Ruminococcaceae bacterium]|nr:ABC transporter [Oscillospiraceae bacterium]
MLELKGVTKSYYAGNTEVQALRDVSVNFRNNEFVAVLGQSGSGKTTLLNVIGGLDRYERGNLIINGRSTADYADMDWDGYRNHSVGFVFQSYNLIMHQTILSNVELALTLSGVSKAERKQRARDVLEKVGLSDQMNKKPNQLSGGQMQRVAIARALVNNPDILLADEPTGALDSQTSLQIMDLISEIAKDRLVIMVTHNPELAEQYANRIIRLTDGEIVDDTNPYTDEECEKEQENLPPPHKAKKGKRSKEERTSMSFGTSLALSFNNLLTKKGRTFLTSFAGSIGIIGIALILALSNGMQAYIDSIEKDTLASYPLTIETESFDMQSLFSSIKDGKDSNNEKVEHEGNKIYRKNQLADAAANLSFKTSTNNLAEFKKFLESNEEIKKLTTDIKYGYNLSPMIYKADTSNGVFCVNPSEVSDAIGAVSSMGGELWSELVGDEELLNSQYDLLDGHWPTNTGEVVLFVDENNEISDYTLYSLGLEDIGTLEAAIAEKRSEEETTEEATTAKKSKKEESTAPKDDETQSYEYGEFLNLSFKLVPNSSIYKKNAKGIWEDKSDDEAYMKTLIDNGKELKIVGIAKPAAKAKTSDNEIKSVAGTIGYLSDLTVEVVNQNNNSAIVKEQKANPKKDVFTGLPFAEAQDEKAEEPTTKATDTAAFETPSVAFLANTAGTPTVTATAGSLQMPEGVETMTEDEIYDYIDKNYKGDDKEEKKELVRLILKDLRSASERKKLIAALDDALKTAGNTNKDVSGEKIYMMLNMMDKDTKLQFITLLFRAAESGSKVEIPADIGSAAGDKKQTTSGKSNTSSTAPVVEEPKFSEATLEENLAVLGAADPNNPGNISIYPIDFEAKEKIKAVIDEYNAQQRLDGNESNVITYTDYVSLIMSSVTSIINIVTYALIAFVAISLIVSSIMIGVITYISVLERTKEIGILRAIGASKKDISRVFRSETIIIGLVSGVLGIGISYLFLVPINAIVGALTEIDGLAVMPIYGVIALIVISVLLTVIAGLSPSKTAAKKDPVIALRTE